MIQLSKKTRKRLRELLILAYKKELDQHLFDLSKEFDDWKDKKIDCWELNDKIHEFHDGSSRVLFNTYNASGVDNVYLISRALAKNLLRLEDIPDEAKDITQKCMNFFERV